MSTQGPDDLNPGDEVAPGTEASAPNVCPRCGGSGRVGSDACETCGGSGEVQEAVGGG